MKGNGLWFESLKRKRRKRHKQKKGKKKICEKSACLCALSSMEKG
jgi:hypothetical protein